MEKLLFTINFCLLVLEWYSSKGAYIRSYPLRTILLEEYFWCCFENQWIIYVKNKYFRKRWYSKILIFFLFKTKQHNKKNKNKRKQGKEEEKSKRNKPLYLKMSGTIVLSGVKTNQGWRMAGRAPASADPERSQQKWELCSQH